MLALHGTAAPARDTPKLELQEDPSATAREIANPAHRSIVHAAVTTAAHATGRFFERRTSVTMRTPGSPKIPTTVCRGRKPGKRYESERRRRGLGNRITRSCHVSAWVQSDWKPLPERVFARSVQLFYPLKSPKTQLCLTLPSSMKWLTRSSSSRRCGGSSCSDRGPGSREAHHPPIRFYSPSSWRATLAGA
jgi:hypothetical protein